MGDNMKTTATTDTTGAMDASLSLQEQIFQVPRDEYLPIADLLENLRQHTGQQRPLDPGKAKKIANAFDPRAVGRLIVNRRADGILWLLDGQHRAHAMRQRGVDLALCSVFEGLTLAEEARLWVEYNTHHMPRGLALYHGALMAEDPETVEIDRLIRSFGYYVPRSDGGNRIRAIAAVGALRYIYRRGSSAGISLTLQICSKAWPEDPRAIDGKVLQGVFIFTLAYRDEFTLKRLEQRLCVTPLSTLYQQSAAQTSAWGGRGQHNFALALVHAYNHGLTVDRRLDPLKLGRAAG